MVEERVTDQVYSLDDERFLPDRYIIGTCPHCGYERANGDQCENCARLLEPSDLINPRSAISGSTRLEVRATRHLFIRQSLMADRVREWIDSHADWPILVTSIARNWLNVGLEDRSITRDLKWGIPVGWPGFENKVFYVWFDAPIEYIGATKEWADLEPDARDWRSWWFDAADVRYTEFLGKDNIPFHTINFPITIMGSGEPWKLVDYVKGFNYLTYYGGKFSTSQQRGVFMDAAIDLLPADYWRYALLACRAGVRRQRVHVGELRAHRQQGPRRHLRQLRAAHPQAHREALRHDRSRRAANPAPRRPSSRRRSTRPSRRTPREMDAMRFRPAAFALRSLWTLGNQYLDRCAPWHETDTARVACILRTAINMARIEAIVSAPFVPFACERLAASLGLTDERALVAGCGERGIADARPRPHPRDRRSALPANRRPEHAGRLGRGDGAALRRSPELPDVWSF